MSRPLRFTLPKSETLHGYQSFARVLSEGASLTQAPIRCFYLLTRNGRIPVKVGFAVTRAVRRAVDRNRIRRFMRESYRTNKQILTSHCGASRDLLQIVFMYISPQSDKQAGCSRREIEKAVISLLKLLNKRSLGPKWSQLQSV